MHLYNLTFITTTYLLMLLATRDYDTFLIVRRAALTVVEICIYGYLLYGTVWSIGEEFAVLFDLMVEKLNLKI